MKLTLETESCKDLRAYIAGTRVVHDNDRLHLDYHQTCELYELARVDPLTAVVLAFEFGKAKGYRAAKARARR